MTGGNTGRGVVVEHPREEGSQPPWIVPDELWARIEPLLPVVPRRAHNSSGTIHGGCSPFLTGMLNHHTLPVFPPVILLAVLSLR